MYLGKLGSRSRFGSAPKAGPGWKDSKLPHPRGSIRHPTPPDPPKAPPQRTQKAGNQHLPNQHTYRQTKHQNPHPTEVLRSPTDTFRPACSRFTTTLIHPMDRTAMYAVLGAGYWDCYQLTTLVYSSTTVQNLYNSPGGCLSE